MSNSIDLPGGTILVDRAVLEIVDGAGPRGRSLKKLAAALADRYDGPTVGHSLERLQERGQVAEVDGRWTGVAGAGYEVGFVEQLDGRRAVIRLDAPRGRRRERVWADRRRLAGAIPGDKVLVEGGGGPRRSSGRRDGEREVSVVRLLAERGEELVGSVEIDEDGVRWLVPFDSREELEIELLAVDEELAGSYVVAQLERVAGAVQRLTARVVEVLGDPAREPGVDVLIVLRHYRIRERFPGPVQELADSFPPSPGEEDFAGREDLRGQTVFTIDGASARDFDDAVSVDRLDGGGFRLGVHIADVAHYVAEGGELDREAYLRGTSVYFPDRAVPMLPEALSNGLCSLRPDVPRLAMSVFMTLDAQGRVVRHRFAETVIQSVRRLTYSEVRRLLEEPAPGDQAEYGPVLPKLLAMRELTSVLNRVRSGRGSLDFDLPSGEVTLDTDGYTVGIMPAERNVAHRLIEELMIAANEAVARELERRAVPALYRVHDPPPVSDLEELADALTTFGIKLEGDLESLQPRALQAVLEEVEGQPYESFVSTLVLRSMSQAVYSPDCRGHYALASIEYCHFTSPIRRYPDLVVHRQLKTLIADRDGDDPGRIAERLPEIARSTSASERQAEAAERDLLQWKKVRFLADRVGETFAGHITGVKPFGLFVQLADLYVDGLLPISNLGDDYYVYEEERHRLVGDNHGRIFRLGDEVEIRLAGVSERHRGLDLELAGGEPRGGRRGRKKTGGRRGEGPGGGGDRKGGRGRGKQGRGKRGRGRR